MSQQNKWNPTGSRFAAFCARFEVPDAAFPVIDRIVEAEEQQIVLALPSGPFSALELKRVLSDIRGREAGLLEAEACAARAYRRGIFLMAWDGAYQLSNFYGRLDVFAISELETYQSFGRHLRDQLDGWYFSAYCSGLSGDEHPTEDAVLPAEKVIERIRRDTRKLYLAPCDCRCLAGLCDQPVMTCLSYKDGVNSFAHRGLSRPVTTEEAVKVIQDSEKAGLIHTVNPDGICNCCGDCCYLFRAQRERKSAPRWPAAKYAAVIDIGRCVECGKCIRRCHLDAFSQSGPLSINRDKCVGCGLCVSGCPTRALRLIPREGRN